MADESTMRTREMRLVSKIMDIHYRRPGSLATFIATRRKPGSTWKSWEEIGYQLRAITGESFTREGVRRWANYLGIPLNSGANDSGPMEAHYLRRIEGQGISLEPTLEDLMVKHES